MTPPERDRRGDRRGEWRCQRGNVERSRAHTLRDGIALLAGATPAPCASTERLEDPDTGLVKCAQCGTVDRRSTEGNRRRAELELAALCRRIERELYAVRGRVDGLEQLGEQLETRVERRRREVLELDRKVDELEDATRAGVPR